MTNPIGRRLDRLESHVENETNPGYGPVFQFIDDPRDPENPKRFKEAEKFQRENPNGLVICRTIVSPPKHSDTRG